MVENRTVTTKLFCMLGSVLLVLASCGGDSTESTSVVADELAIPEVTIPTVDIQEAQSTPDSGDEADPLGPDADDETAGEAVSSEDETVGGGVVPKASGDVQAPTQAPAEPTPAQTPAASPEPAQTPAAAPEPAPALPNTPAPSGGSASDIERRIADLTNQLRTDPNGPLKRTGNVPTCNGKITIDPATGQPQPVSALRFDDAVSVQMARTWSAQMTSNNFNHRSDQKSVLQGLGISPRTWGENIAYHSPPRSDPAMQHFTQWRQSDGHFCNMMNASYTAIGVGEHQHDGGSFATQNFFA